MTEDEEQLLADNVAPYCRSYWTPRASVVISDALDHVATEAYALEGNLVHKGELYSLDGRITNAFGLNTGSA